MALHTIKKGLRLPILGEPVQEITESRPPSPPRKIAVLADDHVGMRPTLHVAVGDEVRRGQLLFEDKKMPGVRHTAPGAGTVVAIDRGERRAFQSLVIELSASERQGRRGDEASFRSFSGKHPSGLTGDEVRELLIESGLWTALRGRPFGRVADPRAKPHSIFVTAIDTSPCAPSVATVLAGAGPAFERGLFVVAKLTDGPVFVCTSPASSLPLPPLDQIRHEEFAGPHPAGTVGVHIHTLDPVDRNKMVWHLGYQDLVTIGKLFETGTLHVERVIALAGPAVRRPRLIRTRVGASTDELVQDELHDLQGLPGLQGQHGQHGQHGLHNGGHRVISGSVLSGRAATGEVFGYLGRYHQQISVLREGREREFLGWLSPGFNKFSTINTFMSKLMPGKKYAFTTSTQGSERAIVPIGMYERVMPMDIMPTFLVRALVVGDVERAEELGCLELDEEDLALCTFVCPGKTEYGPYLREVLTTIEREG